MAPADATCFSNPRSSMLLGSMVPHQVVDPALEPCPVMAVQKKKNKSFKGCPSAPFGIRHRVASAASCFVHGTGFGCCDAMLGRAPQCSSFGAWSHFGTSLQKGVLHSHTLLDDVAECSAPAGFPLLVCFLRCLLSLHL